MAFEKDPNEIGVLWLKESAKGEYMSGTIDGVGSVVLFRVKSTSPKAPTWRVLKSQPRDDQRPASSQRLDDRAPTQRRASRVDDPNDIPFD